MPMLKANGYGTDALTLARLYQDLGAPYLGLSHVSEGVALREKGIASPLFILAAPPFEAEAVVSHRLTPAVSTLEELKALEQEATFQKTTLPIHLHINTGLNRLGASPEEVPTLIRYAASSSHLIIEGVMTHLAAAEDPAHDPFTQKQLSCFEASLAHFTTLPRFIHTQNSPGTLRFSPPTSNLVRIGLALFGYGVDSLSPTLTLTSHLISIQTGKIGETIGYHSHYRIEKPEMKIGVVPIGYHDGIHRRYGKEGYVLIKGKKAKIVGPICMDFFMVDLSDIPHPEVGTLVTLIDTSLPPELVASWAQTDVRELLACLGPRIKRTFIPPKAERRDYGNAASLQETRNSIEKNPTPRQCEPTT